MNAENNFINPNHSKILQKNAISGIYSKMEEILEYMGSCEDFEQAPLLENYNYLQLKSQILSCRSCSLRDSCNLPVALELPSRLPGRDFVVAGLGEAPGADEDSENNSFVGKSGRFMRGTIAKAGLHIDSFLNTCCCRPPKNRTPKPEEVKDCRKNLLAQIDFLNPWLIVCFGSTPLKALRQDLAITRDHGVFFPAEFPELKKKIWAIGVYHPSYILRCSSSSADHMIVRRQWIEDFQFIAAIVDLHKYFYAEMLHPLMEKVRVQAPYIPGDAPKTEKAKILYLQRLEELSESKEEGNYGIEPERVSEHEHIGSGSGEIYPGNDLSQIPF